MKKELLTCQHCGKKSSDVRRIVCGYDREINDVDPNDESRMEDVCEDCETDHLDNI